MRGFFPQPDKFKGTRQVFNLVSTVTNTQWQTWRRPKNASMIYAILVGGGGGGGGGFSANAGNACGGGGGGGSSGITTILFPAFNAPDVLYVQVGAGGKGSTNTGGNGVQSYLSTFPGTTATNIIVGAGIGSTVAQGGTSGSSSSGGPGGSGSTVAPLSAMVFASLGCTQFFAGQTGATGGAASGAVGGNITLPATGLITTGGAGGAGCTSSDFAGGTITNDGSLIGQACASAPAVLTGTGSAGFPLWDPLFFFGGCGGSSSNSNTIAGGNGGTGSYGCGGGGGGGGGGISSGVGGDGGPGIIIIYSW